MEATELEKKIGHSFTNKALLGRALTRKTYASEKKQNLLSSEDCEDQEVFRTLGDAVLKLILMDKFYELGYETREKMTNKNSDLGRKETLAKISDEIGVGSHILLGTGEIRQQADKQPKVLAETLEAITAAIFLDVGYEKSKEIIFKWFEHYIA